MLFEYLFFLVTPVQKLTQIVWEFCALEPLILRCMLAIFVISYRRKEEELETADVGICTKTQNSDRSLGKGENCQIWQKFLAHQQGSWNITFYEKKTSSKNNIHAVPPILEISPKTIQLDGKSDK